MSDADLRRKLALVRAAQRLFGADRAALLWASLGLPEVPALAGRAAPEPEVSGIDLFLARCVTPAPGRRVQSSALYRVYCAWCQSAGDQELTQTAFSRALTARGFRKKHSVNIYWLDIATSMPEGAAMCGYPLSH